MKKFLLLSFFFAFIIGCMDTMEKDSDSSDPRAYRIAYNVLTDENTMNYEVFSMALDGSNKTNISNMNGVDWTHAAGGKYVYFLSDNDTLSRNYFLYKMRYNGEEKSKVSNIRLRDSRYSTRKGGEEILVNTHGSVDTAFYIINKNGELISKIKPDLAYFSDPCFSPDGKQIVFRGATTISKYEVGHTDNLYLMDDDGGNLRQLTNYPEDDTSAPWFAYKAGPPQWHPTDDFISYGSYQQGKYRLFGINPDGSGQRRIMDSIIYGTVWHDWSPDGKWLVMDVSLRDQPPFRIGLVNWESQEFKVLTDSTYAFNQYPVFVEVD